MKATIEFVSEIKSSKYHPTALDEAKAKADILLTAVDSRYEITVKNPAIILSGRGIKRSEWVNNVYYVTERIYKQLCAKYHVECDF